MIESDSTTFITGATNSFKLSILALIFLLLISVTYGKRNRDELANEMARQNRIQEDFSAGIISGKFRFISGNSDCAKFLIVRVVKDDLFLDKVDNELSNRVWETEAYTRSAGDKYKFVSVTEPQAQITILSPTQFYFSDPGVRNCTFSKMLQQK